MRHPNVPEGFRPLRLTHNPYIEANGPLYGRLDGADFVLGLRCEKKHCNPMGMCHGGMLMTFADMLLLLGSNIQARIGRFLVTVHLATDFIGAVPQGSWLEGRMQVLKATRSLLFTQGTMEVDGVPVARASAILKPTGEHDPDYSPDRYFT
jgi:uncharacterized protein (TIGR00369 family)